KELRADDRVLLCTDGVWSTLTGDRMVEVLSMQANAAWMAQLLTKEAAEGGYDNATAIVLTVEPGGLRDGDDDEGECCEELPSAPCTPSYPALGYN
ncbi:MAG: hypothetical protein IJC51_04425, partial [Eggerthellaceae bacterium]|nr:hypothetical protein [Eggerthellaceae bacterium]